MPPPYIILSALLTFLSIKQKLSSLGHQTSDWTDHGQCLWSFSGTAFNRRWQLPSHNWQAEEFLFDCSRQSCLHVGLDRHNKRQWAECLVLLAMHSVSARRGSATFVKSNIRAWSSGSIGSVTVDRFFCLALGCVFRGFVRLRLNRFLCKLIPFTSRAPSTLPWSSYKVLVALKIDNIVESPKS